MTEEELIDQIKKLEAKNEKLRQEIKEWQKMARRILPVLIPVQKDMKTLAKKLLQVKPELREWLEVNFKEYL